MSNCRGSPHIVYYDLDLTATNDYGDSIRAYTLSEYMQKIESLELSYDEWVVFAIEGENVIDESDVDESETEVVNVVQNNDEESILNQIMEQAKKDWPNDKDMQEFQYNNQVEAYHDILDLPNTSDYRENILVKAQKDWLNDYEMQLFQYNNQLEAYHDIINLPSTSDYRENILAKAQSDWPSDYEMQLFQYNNQLDAYLEIQQLPYASDYNEAALTRAKSDWPGDYEMQLWQYNNEK